MYDQHTISRSSILYGTRDEDVWYNLDQFYKDQLQEVNEKLSQLDDEIWGKIVLMEKNKRIGKAYLRQPRFRVDGSRHEFDGQRIGYKSFTTLSSDAFMEEIKAKIGVVLLKMDQQGNILAKRGEGTSPVIVQGWDRSDVYCHGTDVAKSRGRLEQEKPSRVFDMRIFKAAIETELRQPYPDRKKLLYKSAIRLSMVKDESHPFRTPFWFMLINIVALDMLNANVPSVLQSVRPCSPSMSAVSRCHSASSDRLLSGASSDHLFSPAVFSDGRRSPVWSDTYDHLITGAEHDCKSRLSAQLANRLALSGHDEYVTQSRQHWSTSHARSVDCLYCNEPPNDRNQQTSCYTTRTTDRSRHRHRPWSEDEPFQGSVTTGRTGHEKHIYAVAARPTGKVSAISDSESSSSSGGGISQKEIYESSTNSSCGISCRPSSPSLVSESTSESNIVSSTFTLGSIPDVTNVPSSYKPGPSVNNCGRSSCLVTQSTPVTAPDPPSKPRSLLKSAVLSRLLGLNVLKRDDNVLAGKTAVLARYNNVKLDTSQDHNWHDFGDDCHKNSGKNGRSRERTGSCEEVYRL